MSKEIDKTIGNAYGFFNDDYFKEKAIMLGKKGYMALVSTRKRDYHISFLVENSNEVVVTLRPEIHCPDPYKSQVRFILDSANSSQNEGVFFLNDNGHICILHKEKLRHAALEKEDIEEIVGHLLSLAYIYANPLEKAASGCAFDLDLPVLDIKKDSGKQFEDIRARGFFPNEETESGGEAEGGEETENDEEMENNEEMEFDVTSTIKMLDEIFNREDAAMLSNQFPCDGDELYQKLEGSNPDTDILNIFKTLYSAQNVDNDEKNTCLSDFTVPNDMASDDSGEENE